MGLGWMLASFSRTDLPGISDELLLFDVILVLTCLREIFIYNLLLLSMILCQAWLLFLYTGLALRENILRVNGSDIRPWYSLQTLLNRGFLKVYINFSDPYETIMDSSYLMGNRSLILCSVLCCFLIMGVQIL